MGFRAPKSSEIHSSEILLGLSAAREEFLGTSAASYVSGIQVRVQGLCDLVFWELRGLRVNGKENGNYYVMQGYIGVRLRDNGKENGRKLVCHIGVI